MSLNFNNFVFHSSRTPYGTPVVEEFEVDWAGTIPSVGDYIWVKSIDIDTGGLVPRMFATVPSVGSWSIAFFGPAASGTVVIDGSMSQDYGTWWGVCTPTFEYTPKGIRFGIRRSWSAQNTPTGTRTLPSRKFKIKATMDVIPGIPQ